MWLEALKTITASGQVAGLDTHDPDLNSQASNVRRASTTTQSCLTEMGQVTAAPTLEPPCT